jgi:hypothetical protein
MVKSKFWLLAAEYLNLRVYHRSYKAYKTYLRTSNPEGTGNQKPAAV